MIALEQFAEEFCARNIAITQAKNADYTGGKDIWYNFEQVEQYGVDPVDGFITRMVDKISRIETFLANKKLQVTNESGMDTLHDLANYAMLLYGYLNKEHNLVMHADKFYGAVQDNLRGKASIETIKMLLKLIATHLTARLTYFNLIKIAVNCVLLAYESQQQSESKDNDIDR